MHSHNFQDAELKLCRYVEEYPRQVRGVNKIWGAPGAGHTYNTVVKARATPGNPASDIIIILTVM